MENNIEDIGEEQEKDAPKASKSAEVIALIALLILSGVVLAGILAGIKSTPISSEPVSSPTTESSKPYPVPSSEKTISSSDLVTPSASMEILRKEIKEKEGLKKEEDKKKDINSTFLILFTLTSLLIVLFIAGMWRGLRDEQEAKIKDITFSVDGILGDSEEHYETLKEEAEYYKRRFKESQKEARKQKPDKQKTVKMSKKQLREYYRSQWNKVLVMHDDVINEWLEWTKNDIDKIIDYPSLQDSSQSFVHELINSLQDASILRPEGQVTEVMDVTESSYAKAVKDLRSSWDKAKKEATRIGRSKLPLSVQKDLDVVENLLARINHAKTPIPEKVQAAKQIQKLLNGVVELGQKPMNMLKTVERLEITQHSSSF